MAFALPPEREPEIDALIARYPAKRAALIPLLHLCQRERGWIDGDVIDYAASRLDLSTAQVQGVVTFYTMFHKQPVAPNVVWVCRTLSCDLAGGKVLTEHLEKRFACHTGETSSDGKFTLLKAECLAACGQAPMVQINDDFFENLTVQELDRILDEIAAKTSASRGLSRGTKE